MASGLDEPLPALNGSMSGDSPELSGGFGESNDSPALQGSMNFMAGLPQPGGQAGPQPSFDTRDSPSLTSQPPTPFDVARAFMR